MTTTIKGVYFWAGVDFHQVVRDNAEHITRVQSSEEQKDQTKVLLGVRKELKGVMNEWYSYMSQMGYPDDPATPPVHDGNVAKWKKALLGLKQYDTDASKMTHLALTDVAGALMKSVMLVFRLTQALFDPADQLHKQVEFSAPVSYATKVPQNLLGPVHKFIRQYGSLNAEIPLVQYTMVVWLVAVCEDLVKTVNRRSLAGPSGGEPDPWHFQYQSIPILSEGAVLEFYTDIRKSIITYVEEYTTAANVRMPDNFPVVPVLTAFDWPEEFLKKSATCPASMALDERQGKMVATRSVSVARIEPPIPPAAKRSQPADRPGKKRHQKVAVNQYKNKHLKRAPDDKDSDHDRDGEKENDHRKDAAKTVAEVVDAEEDDGEEDEDDGDNHYAFLDGGNPTVREHRRDRFPMAPTIKWEPIERDRRAQKSNYEIDYWFRIPKGSQSLDIPREQCIRFACPYCYRNWWFQESYYSAKEKEECFYKVLGCTDVWHHPSKPLPRALGPEEKFTPNVRKLITGKRSEIRKHIQDVHTALPVPVAAKPLINCENNITNREDNAAARRKAKNREDIEKKIAAGLYTDAQLAKRDAQRLQKNARGAATRKEKRRKEADAADRLRTQVNLDLDAAPEGAS
jgi:hypothetical protein